MKIAWLLLVGPDQGATTFALGGLFGGLFGGLLSGLFGRLFSGLFSNAVFGGLGGNGVRSIVVAAACSKDESRGGCHGKELVAPSGGVHVFVLLIGIQKGRWSAK